MTLEYTKKPAAGATYAMPGKAAATLAAHAVAIAAPAALWMPRSAEAGMSRTAAAAAHVITTCVVRTGDANAAAVSTMP